MPSLNEVIGIVRGEESRRGVMLDPQSGEGLAMAVRGASTKTSGIEKTGWIELGMVSLRFCFIFRAYSHRRSCFLFGFSVVFVIFELHHLCLLMKFAFVSRVFLPLLKFAFRS